MPHPSLRLIVPFVLFAAAAPVAAKDKAPPPRPAQIQEVYDCRDIADPAARLACFDRAVGELQTADTRRDISFADRETVKKTRRGLFGFTLPSLGLFGGDGDEDGEEVEDGFHERRRCPGFLTTEYSEYTEGRLVPG